ncbi:shikimate dehydrogenase [Sulfurivermis fontis]|uniref:shikimate dehydrogenase n=1 Tax=Sulfurivermis fontis TaxID=1972068 RepID=UPI000FDBA076|nr:shikimate dehydrogenase [Sulfurivermis fontis]
MTDRYAVMGNPIAHSKSPYIHARFAEQTDQDLSYEAILVELGDFPAAVARFRAAGGLGLNVTVPFKQEAWALATRRSGRAERAGAVNTLRWEADGSLFGDNTDGVGLVRDLKDNHGVPLAGRRLLLLGAGGAVRGVLEPLLAERPATLTIANRTVAKAEELAAAFADLGPLQASSFAALAGQQFDVVINGTAASLQGEVPPLPDGILAPGAVCYDMMYGKEPTPFLRWAMAAGAAQAVDGLGMLVEQAAEAFFLWRGVRPASAEVIAALR